MPVSNARAGAREDFNGLRAPRDSARITGPRVAGVPFPAYRTYRSPARVICSIARAAARWFARPPSLGSNLSPE